MKTMEQLARALLPGFTGEWVGSSLQEAALSAARYSRFSLFLYFLSW